MWRLILKRVHASGLRAGVATLAKMAGKDAAPPEFEVSGPTLSESNTHKIQCTLRRGVTSMKFCQEFTICKGKITLLQNSRL